MRIVARLNVGGPATHVTLLNEGLTHLGMKCLLVTGMEGAREGSMKDMVTARQLSMKIIPELGREINPRYDLVTLFKLYRLMRRWQPDIVHTHTAKAGFVGRVAARLAGVPLVLHTFHGHVFHGYFGAAKTRLFIELEKFCARMSDRLITISPHLRQEIASYGIADPAQILVIPLGFELQAMKLLPPKGKFLHQLGLRSDEGLIAAVGRLVPIKNLHLFLDAAAIAHQQNPQIRFALIGDGELRQELEAYAQKLAIDDAVIFTGWRRDLPQIYADLDGVVISSNNEGTPASLIEAMAAGCPVISTRVGGVPDIITDGQTGRIVPPQNAEALAKAMLSIFQSPADTRKMADRAREFALHKFNRERLISDIDNLYNHLFVNKVNPNRFILRNIN